MGPHGLGDRNRVVARKACEAAGQERLELEMAAVLLADENDERCAVGAGGRERADCVAEPRGGMQHHERGLVSPDREAGRHADYGALV